MPEVGKKRTLAGRWVEVLSPWHGHTRVFVPTQVFAEGTLPAGAYLVPMVGEDIPVGMMAVVVYSKITPHLCVGMARLMCAQALQELT